jgi:hypothetical protein
MIAFVRQFWIIEAKKMYLSNYSCPADLYRPYSTAILRNSYNTA